MNKTSSGHQSVLSREEITVGIKVAIQHGKYCDEKRPMQDIVAD